MERRFYVEKTELEEIKSELKHRGFTLDDISDRIGCSFRNCLYRETSLEPESFRKLKSMYGDAISHEVKYLIDGGGFQEPLKAAKSAELAELVGYLLGDGCISAYTDKDKQNACYYVGLTLHKDEEGQQERGRKLFKETLGESLSIEEPEGQNIVHLKLYGKRFVDFFDSVGLESGDKVENQISVPGWIYNSRSFVKSCLRGLIDTDGSIYRRSEDGYIVVNFKNRSENLLDDFMRMCDEIGIKASKSGRYDRQVASQDEVEKLIDLIEPIKSQCT